MSEAIKGRATSQFRPWREGRVIQVDMDDGVHYLELVSLVKRNRFSVALFRSDGSLVPGCGPHEVEIMDGALR